MVTKKGWTEKSSRRNIQVINGDDTAPKFSPQRKGATAGQLCMQLLITYINIRAAQLRIFALHKHLEYGSLVPGRRIPSIGSRKLLANQCQTELSCARKNLTGT